MSQEQLEPASTPSVLPEALQLSSAAIGWQALELAQWQGLAAQKMEASALSQHLIVVHLTPRVIQVEEVVDDLTFQGETRPGDINILSAGSDSSCCWDKPIDFFSLNLDPVFLDRIARESEGFGSGVVELTQSLHIQDPMLVQVSQWLAQEVRSKNAGGQLYVDSLMNLLGVHLLRHYCAIATPSSPETSIGQTQIQHLLAFLHDHFDQDIALDDLAQLVHISPAHLRRVFKQATGVAPHQYLLQLRVDRAKALLQSGNHSIRDVALQVGFADQSHLNRHFKKYLGVTPKQVMPR
jgi:AraC family transcriptional regulator